MATDDKSKWRENERFGKTTRRTVSGYKEKNTPKEINRAFGYRTNMSMKNKDTWLFAHLYFGKLWFFIGWILLVISVFAMLVVVGQGIDCVGTVGGILASVQCVVMIVPIIPTERALKRRFNF